MIEKENLVLSKSRDFAIRIIRCYKYLCEEHKEYTLSKQLLRCGTSIGANVKESINAQSKNDFISKLNIALKEASESGYWIDLLHDTDYLSDSEYESIFADCKRIIAVLTKIVKATKTPN